MYHPTKLQHICLVVWFLPGAQPGISIYGVLDSTNTSVLFVEDVFNFISIVFVKGVKVKYIPVS